MMDALGSLVSGGALGVIGSLASNVVGFFKAGQDHRQSVELAKLEHEHRISELRAEAEFKTAQLQIESETARLVAEQQALASSYGVIESYDGDRPLLVFAEFARRITRPALTFLLVLLCGGVYVVGAPDERDLIARAIVAMTATVVGWWFSDRAIAKQVAGRVL